jgi:hypothetical protein
MKIKSSNPLHSAERAKPIMIGTGTVLGGIVTAGGGTVVELIVGGLSILNGADDIGTNKKGESLIESQVSSPTAKKAVVATKLIISAANATRGAANTVLEGGELPEKIGEGIGIVSEGAAVQEGVEKMKEYNDKKK